MNKLMTNLVGTFLVLTSPVPSKRRDRGQGSLEYVAMIAVAAIIIALVAGVAKTQGPLIAAFITDAVTKVKTAVTG